MSFSAEDVQRYIDSDVGGVNDDDSEDFWYAGGTLKPFGEFTSVGSWNLGDGHEQGVVLKHVESGRLFRKSGYCSSWDSTDWDGPFEEVEAVKVEVTKYRAKDSAVVYDYPFVG